MSKGFWLMVVLIVAVLGGIFALTGSHSSTSKSSSLPTQHVIGENKDHITLLEYGDYECPFCGEYYPVLKEVQAKYNTQIAFQFRNFPLVNIHQNAFAAARAAEAAGLMGKFWEMHDLLYQTQQQWAGAADAIPYFNQYAQQIGLNLKTFQNNYVSSQVNDLINADTAAGDKLNVQGTPAFFLNGKQIQASIQASAFEKIIDAAIAHKNGTDGNSSAPTTSSGTTQQTKK